MKKKYIFLGIVGLILIAVLYVASFNVKIIKVVGCNVVNEQVVKDAVTDNGKMRNTLYVYLHNKFKPVKNIPFVSKIDVEFVSKNTISVTVYEKSMAGCVQYAEGYVFFDKDGIILESAASRIEGVPLIKGLSFDSFEVGKKIPINDESKFTMILSITQLIEKYQLSIDSIEFTAGNEIVLYHEGISIELGKGENLALQMMNLGSILEGLKGCEGVLYMKDFTSDDATASFSKKKEEKSTKTDADAKDTTEENSGDESGEAEYYEPDYDDSGCDDSGYDDSDYDDSGYDDSGYDDSDYDDSGYDDSDYDDSGYDDSGYDDSDYDDSGYDESEYNEDEEYY